MVCPYCKKQFFPQGRTNQQNRWYWSCVVAIPADHFGYTPDEMHEAFKFMFLRREEQGKPLTVGSTATMTTKEFVDYSETCRRWCAEQGLVIPDPPPKCGPGVK